MRLKAVPEKDASESVQRDYAQLKSTLNLSNVPLFFQYMGNFPEYLSHITGQVTSVTKNQNIIEMVNQHDYLVREIMESVGTSRDLSLPENAPYRTHMKDISKSNALMTILFISLRETVKSWASLQKQIVGTDRDLSLYETNDLPLQTQDFVSDPTEYGIVPAAGLVKANQGITVSKFPEFLDKMYAEFQQLQKTERLLFFRVKLEEMILKSISDLGNPVFSPYNLVLKLTMPYENFNDMVYLLADHFPRYAVERWLFSAWLAG